MKLSRITPVVLGTVRINAPFVHETIRRWWEACEGPIYEVEDPTELRFLADVLEVKEAIYVGTPVAAQKVYNVCKQLADNQQDIFMDELGQYVPYILNGKWPRFSTKGDRADLKDCLDEFCRYVTLEYLANVLSNRKHYEPTYSNGMKEDDYGMVVVWED